MKNTNLISYKEYIIDIDAMTYKAAWDCQVEWTDECIFYDAETGTIQIDAGEIEFIREHQHRITKHEYLQYEAELRELDKVDEEGLKERFRYREVV